MSLALDDELIALSAIFGENNVKVVPEATSKARVLRISVIDLLPSIIDRDSPLELPHFSGVETEGQFVRYDPDSESDAHAIRSFRSEAKSTDTSRHGERANAFGFEVEFAVGQKKGRKDLKLVVKNLRVRAKWLAPEQVEGLLRKVRRISAQREERDGSDGKSGDGKVTNDEDKNIHDSWILKRDASLVDLVSNICENIPVPYSHATQRQGTEETIPQQPSESNSTQVRAADLESPFEEVVADKQDARERNGGWVCTCKPGTVTKTEDNNIEILHSAEFVEKKSIFQSHAAVVKNDAEVQEVIAALYTNKNVATATHNMVVYTYDIALKPKAIKPNMQRANLRDKSEGMKNERTSKKDRRIAEEKLARNEENAGDAADISQYCDHDSDGESGAGSKMQWLISTMKVRNVFVMVSRWYGGIQLGPDRFRIINRMTRDAALSLQSSSHA